MARKDSQGDIHKHTLNLYAGDYEKIRDLYPDIGAGAVIRRLVRDYIEKIEAGSESAAVKVEVRL